MEKVVKITDYGMDGAGVAHEDGKTYFLSNVLLGEKVALDDVGGAKVLALNKHRITPLCPYYFKCGGCNIGCMDEFEQQNYKTRYVKNCFAKYKTVLPEKLDYYSNYELNYRNKVSFGVRRINNKNVIGLFAFNTHEIIEIDECKIVDKRNKDLLKVLRWYLALDDVLGYDEQNKSGDIRNIVVRFCEKGVLLCVVGHGNLPPHLDMLYAKLLDVFKIIGLSYCQNKDMRTILSANIKHLYGITECAVNKNGLSAPVNIGSFVQVNDDVSAALYEYVTEQCAGDNIVFDLYSGAGLMTAMLAQQCKLVFGIESNLYAVNASTKLQQQNNIKNATNIWGKVEEVLPNILNESIKDKKFKCRNKVLDLNNNLFCVLDPPRKGCDTKVLSTILQSPIDKVVYVSCNPLTLARDTSVLLKNYKIESIKLFDMFNMTSHIETVLVLRRK